MSWSAVAVALFVLTVLAGWLLLRLRVGFDSRVGGGPVADDNMGAPEGGRRPDGQEWASE
jgi:hypothetical protein